MCYLYPSYSGLQPEGLSKRISTENFAIKIFSVEEYIPKTNLRFLSIILSYMTPIPYKWLVAVVFIAGLFMNLMDMTIVNVALPTLGKELHANSATLEWVVNGYLLSMAIWIPASGWIGDKFGTKRIFLLSLTIFTLGSMFCGLSHTIESLIFFRVIQGIGGGMMTPVGTTMLFRAFPPAERARASAVLAIPTALSPVLGPILGGWLVEYTTWHWIFWVNVPIGITTFLFGAKFIKEYIEKDAGRFDFAGFFLSAGSLVLLLYALSRVPSAGWLDTQVILSSLSGIILLFLLIRIEKKTQKPILHFGLLKDRIFKSSNIIMFFAYSVWLGFLFILPLFLQQFRDLSALTSGLVIAPQALGWIVISPIVSKFYPRLGPRFMAITGLIGFMITSLFFIFVNMYTSLWIISIIMFFRGLFMVFAMIPIQAAAFSNISQEEMGRASSLFNTNRQVAASFGVAFLGAFLFQLSTVGSTQLIAYQVTFLVTALLSLIAAVFAFTIKDADARASMDENYQKASVGE